MATAYVLINCDLGSEEFVISELKSIEGVVEVHGTFGAYDILDKLRSEGLGSQPPVAYRALDFLVTHGFAHKIERLNAFVACAHPGEVHDPAFLICRKCDGVAEAQTKSVRGQLGSSAEIAGFQIERAVLEAVGVCPNCAERPAT